MKVLAIIGTPTREAGCTTRSVKILEQSLKAAAEVEFEYAYLGDLQLGGCQGHLSCIRHGEDVCPFSSDVGALTEQMNTADAVIFASPVHCFNVSTLLKNMIDLYVYQMHRPSFFGKKAIVVATAAGAGQRGVLKYMKKTFANWGFHVTGQLGTHAGFFDEASYQPKLKTAADKLAADLVSAVAKNELPKPGVAELINFGVWRAMVRRTEKDSPYDWAHWQRTGWINQDYYFKARINPFSLALARFIERMIERTIRKASANPLT